jgi:GT2 family glycosyltransferase
MVKILCGIPCYSEKKYCWEAFLENLNKMIAPNMDVLFVDSSKRNNRLKIGGYFSAFDYQKENITPLENGRETLAAAQNIIRKHALKNEYTHVLFLEQDIFPEKYDLMDLLSCNKPVVGRPYFKYSEYHKDDFIVWTEVITLPDGSLDAQVIPVIDVYDKLNGNLQEVFNIGVGFCLIEKQVFQDIEFRVVKNEEPHSDTYFAQDLFSKKIPFYAKTEIIKHIDTEFNNKIKK